MYGKNINYPKTKKILSVFPVTPFIESYWYQEFTIRHYYNSQNSIKFLKDIIFCLKDLELEILIKHKRDITQIDPNYHKFINEIKTKKGIKIIDSKISAISLIDKSDLVISSPYSSPSFIANNFNIPAVFYDSSNSLTQPEPHINKIKLIKGENQLYEWITLNLNNKT